MSSPLLQTEIQTCTELCYNVGRPKRLFVFVNPFGGKKSAAKIFDEQVKPLLEDAQIEITVQGALILRPCFVVVLLPFQMYLYLYTCMIWFSSETKHQLHAKEVTQSLDITKYDGIVCVSGDGILVEVSFIAIILVAVCYYHSSSSSCPRLLSKILIIIVFRSHFSLPFMRDMLLMYELNNICICCL